MNLHISIKQKQCVSAPSNMKVASYNESEPLTHMIPKDSLNMGTPMNKNAGIISECAEMTPKNKRLALTLKGEVDRTAKLKAYVATTPSRVFKVGDGVVHEILELENGYLAISGIKDNLIRIFDSKTGRLVKLLKGHQDYIMGMVNIPKQSTLVSYSCDKSIKLWSTKHGYINVRNFERSGMILNLHIIEPELLVIQESQSTSFFIPTKITEVLSIKNGCSVKKFNKSDNLGKLL